MKLSRRHLLLILPPVFLLAAVFVAKRNAEIRLEQSQEARLREVVGRGTRTEQLPQGFVPTQLPIKIAALENVTRSQVIPPPKYTPKAPPTVKILLALKITNQSNHTLVLVDFTDVGRTPKPGFYRETDTLLSGSPLAAISDYGYPVAGNPRWSYKGTNLLFHSVSPLSPTKNFEVLLPRQSAIVDLYLNYESNGSYPIYPFVGGSGNYQMRVALVFKVNGKGHYVISEPLRFRVIR